jgi:hypothetical protein
VDSKVFDVSKPGRTASTPTSRPIIVGQRPAADPMVNSHDNQSPAEPSPSFGSTPIHVSMGDEESHDVMANSPMPPSTLGNNDSHNEEAPKPEAPKASAPPSGATIPPGELDQDSQTTPVPDGGSAPGSTFTPLTSLIPNVDASGKEDTGAYGAHHVDKLPQSHDGGMGNHDFGPLQAAPGAGPKRRWPKVLLWLFILALIAVIGGFIAIDGGYVKSSVKLPFHILNKQKYPGVAAPTHAPAPPANNPISQPPAQSTVPTGFTTYKVDGAEASFAYPSAWGAPTVTKDPGFSKRGGANKSDGTHAYLVDFATNKDVEVALTSSKYLPAARTALYYDFLQWCVGTNDGKLYKQTLKFTTDATKVDTPGTITCDQGPLSDAVKLDDTTTIFQQKTKDAAGAVLGDLYTRNLTGKDLAVLRIKDAQSKNGADIKKMLATIKLDPSATASGTNTSPVSTGQ